MELNNYKIKIHFAYELVDGHKEHREGFEIVSAKNPKLAKVIAKARAQAGLEKQGAKIVFLDIGDVEEIKTPL